MPVSEMRDILMEAALPLVPGESIKAQINRAARRTQLGFSRVRSYWYNAVRLVPAQEADHLRAFRRQMFEERLRAMDEEAATLRARLAEWKDAA